MESELNRFFFEIVYKVLNNKITEIEYIKNLHNLMKSQLNVLSIDIVKKIIFLFFESKKYLVYSFTLIYVTKEFIYDSINNNQNKKLLIGKYIEKNNKIDNVLNYIDSLTKSLKLLKSTCQIENKKLNDHHHMEAISRINFIYKKIGIIYLSTLEIDIYDNTYLGSMRQNEIIDYLRQIFKKVGKDWKSIIYKCYVFLDLEKRYIELLINKDENLLKNDNVNRTNIIMFSKFSINIE